MGCHGAIDAIGAIGDVYFWRHQFSDNLWALVHTIPIKDERMCSSGR